VEFQLVVLWQPEQSPVCCWAVPVGGRWSVGRPCSGGVDIPREALRRQARKSDLI
jgi:hypothetical protein